MSATFASVPPEIPDELLDRLLAGQPLSAAGITGPDGLLKQLTKRLVERAMGAELSGHLGYGEGESPPAEQPNRRRGSSSKTLITGQGAVRLEIPRVRAGCVVRARWPGVCSPCAWLARAGGGLAVGVAGAGNWWVVRGAYVLRPCANRSPVVVRLCGARRAGSRWK